MRVSLIARQLASSIDRLAIHLLGEPTTYLTTYPLTKVGRRREERRGARP